METTPPINHYDEELRPEVLIGRLIDGEASENDRQMFERMADHQPALWRDLALRHEDAARLSASVEPMLDRLERAAAPMQQARETRRRLLTMPVALSGWAAMIIIGLTWAIVSMVHMNEQPANGNVVAQPPVSVPFTFTEHMERYRSAPWVLGEMQPHLMEWEELEDGRVRLRYLRRFEEQLIAPKSEAEEVFNPERGVVDEALLKQLREEYRPIVTDGRSD